MKLTDLFIRRPVLAVVVNLIILIAGLQSVRTLAVRQYPRSDIAVINVSTVYVGAGADLVRGFITTPLERVIASADGIDFIESSSAQGVSTITVHLKLNYDTNAALTQSQSKVAQVRNTLPPEAEAPIIDLHTADAQFAAMYIGFASDGLDQNQITDYLTRVGQPKLSAIADVVLGAENYDTDVRFSGQTATFMGLWVLPTANSLEIVRRVREALPDIQAQMPAGIRAAVAYDSTVYIENAIEEVLKTLGETLLIVIVVIYLFLGSVRAVMIPVVAIPISLVGAVFLMLVAGFSINLLTLLAIVLSVGLVVDDAIVMVENVERHLSLGQRPIEAALAAARELVGPIIAMTITLATVYTPVAIQGGLTGTLFREFAFTLAGAVIVSGIVALTLSPMMGSRLLRAGDTERGFAGLINRRFESLRSLYTRALSRTLAFRPVVLVLWAIVVALMAPFYIYSQHELAPTEDQGFVFAIIQSAPNATLEQTMLFATKVSEVFGSFPESDITFQITSPGGGFGGMVLKPWSQRKKTAEQLKMEAAAALSKLPGVRMIPLSPPPLPGSEGFPVDFIVGSTGEPAQIAELAGQLVRKAYASGYFMYADTDVKFDQPQTEVVFDRDKVRSLGVDMSQAGADLSTLLGGNYVNRFSIQGRSYKVIPQVKRSERLTADQLKDIYVTGPEGRPVPLSTFATLRTSTEPRELKRFQQLNAVRIQGAIPPNVSLDQALRFLEKESKSLLPAGYSIDYAGESRQLRTEGRKFLGVFVLSAILIYLVLAAQFESFRDPFIILAGSVPLALSGALLFSFLGLTTLNIYSQVGLITLVGLVSKNGILIVEFANKLQEQGKLPLNAITEAAGPRLRPVLMTTAATVVGHLTLVFATGPGAGARNSIGMMLVTGMIIGTAFTLFVVPSIYVLVARTRALAPSTRAGEEPAADLAPAAV